MTSPRAPTELDTAAHTLAHDAPPGDAPPLRTVIQGADRLAWTLLGAAIALIIASVALATCAEPRGPDRPAVARVAS